MRNNISLGLMIDTSMVLASGSRLVADAIKKDALPLDGG